MEFYSLKIKNITPETSDTATLEFDIPAELAEIFKYKQGQYVTIRAQINGQEIRRSYSMSSSPLENRLAVTVKKVSGGKMSGFLHDQTKVGDVLDLAHPEGRFTSKLDPEKRHTYYLFGAGSGITPLMSILRTILEAEPMSTISLLYGSRNEESIIFKEALEQLTAQYAGQLHVEHILSQPRKEGGGGLFGMFKKSTTNWLGKMGRVELRAVKTFLEEHPPHGPLHDCIYFICGPDNMAENVQSALLGEGIPAAQIHVEHFANSHHVPGDIAAAASGTGPKLIAHLKGERIEIDIPAGATILDALVKEKYDAPYSCTSGACATCMGKVIQGEVKMDVCYALDDDEIKAGYCLTCQSRPVSDLVEISYDL
ncbi:MAG: ferredoxin--NADP reductase [Lewinellaceae bacterium]|nr:ferredoxin--NADP reductase [Lewinellaceae bacterium]